MLSALRSGAVAIVRTRALRRITVASAIAYAGTGMLIVACPLVGRRSLGGALMGAVLLAVAAAASPLVTAVLARWPLAAAAERVFVTATSVTGCGAAALALRRKAEDSQSWQSAARPIMPS